MMQNYLLDQVAESHDRSVRAKEALKTKADAQRYVAEVQAKIAASFGPRPEKTNLAAAVTGVLKRDGYRVENVIFHSRPNFPITANLYLPDSKVPVPGVVGTCGHSTNGKAAPAYQSFAQGLARQGYACLIFDPIGQGERLQYPTDGNRSSVGIGVREHIHCGNQQYLVGENLAMWRAWDGIRALDYLLTREEVDPKHLGVTGNSGGGTMTTWLCGVERRWTMAAPSCFVTTFQHNARNELPADTEQCPPQVLAHGLEHEDFIIAHAPKPVVVLAKEKDFFDVRGAEEAAERTRRVYRLLGAEQNFELFVGPTEHGFSIENREAMYRAFNKATGIEAASPESAIKQELDRDLWCTKSGQVAERRPATVFSFTAEKAQMLGVRRTSVAGTDLDRLVRSVLKIPKADTSGDVSFRILRTMSGRKLPRAQVSTYVVETEPRAAAICYRLGDDRLQSRPPQIGGKRVMLYVGNRSSDDELREMTDWLSQKVAGFAGELYAVDVRGIGESLPNTCGINSFDNVYGCDYFYAAHAIMLDRPYLGQKVLDVLATLRFLKSFGAKEVELVGQKWGALIATLAAVLSPSVSRVSVLDRIETFENLATDEHYDMPLAYLPPGVLKHFDLTDCDRHLGDRLKKTTSE
ncbi:MAG: alpha/beta hydrolase family protein [Aureliella sp.]